MLVLCSQGTGFALAMKPQMLCYSSGYLQAYLADLATANEDKCPPGRMVPRQVLKELEKAMPGDAMVSTDIGNTCSVSNSYLKFSQPKSMLAAMAFGYVGGTHMMWFCGLWAVGWGLGAVGFL